MRYWAIICACLIIMLIISTYRAILTWRSFQPMYSMTDWCSLMSRRFFGRQGYMVQLHISTMSLTESMI